MCGFEIVHRRGTNATFCDRSKSAGFPGLCVHGSDPQRKKKFRDTPRRSCVPLGAPRDTGMGRATGNSCRTGFRRLDVRDPSQTVLEVMVSVRASKIYVCLSDCKEGENKLSIPEAKTSEVVVAVGTEGGTIALYGLRTDRGWVFEREVHDWTPDLLGEEPVRTNLSAENWDAALGLLDRYRWPTLLPLSVHPDFQAESLGRSLGAAGGQRPSNAN